MLRSTDTQVTPGVDRTRPQPVLHGALESLSRITYAWRVSGSKSEPHFGSTWPSAVSGRGQLPGISFGLCCAQGKYQVVNSRARRDRAGIDAGGAEAHGRGLP
jgi:hypothetical protein